MSSNITKVAGIGTGVIGAGWIIRALAHNKKGVLASNAQLVEKAIRIITDMGATTLTPKETRQKLKLKKHK